VASVAFRYQAALPVRIAKPITLGEGCTPLVEQAWGDLRPHFKLEWFNPTGSFKVRACGTQVIGCCHSIS
jgi:threonine synthase